MKIREITEAKIQIISEDKTKDVMSVIVPFIQAGERNRNGRSTHRRGPLGQNMSWFIPDVDLELAGRLVVLLGGLDDL